MAGTLADGDADLGFLRTLGTRLSLRIERRALQLRALRRARDLKPAAVRVTSAPPGPILITVIRNEATRLRWFLNYYRRLGIVHFLVVDNGSTDDTAALLTEQPDVSTWRTPASYRRARFGMDWINHLLTRHARSRWVLVADADEFLVYPHCTSRSLPALTRRLDDIGVESFGTMLLDLYGKGPVAQTQCRPGEDPVRAAPWFDAANYVVNRDPRYHNLWIQGGPRMRAFFADAPDRAPALNKIPLVRWRRGFVFKTGAHDLLPRRLNRTYASDGTSRISGVLLHTKFLSDLTVKVAEEKNRKEHYAGGAEYRRYAARSAAPLWTPQSTRYHGWRQLCDLGLMAEGGWQ